MSFHRRHSLFSSSLRFWEYAENQDVIVTKVGATGPLFNAKQSAFLVPPVDVSKNEWS